MKSILIAAILLITLNLNAQKSGFGVKSDTLISISTDKLPTEKLEILNKLFQLDELKKLITSAETNEKKASLYFDAGIISYDLDEYQEAVDYFTKSLELITYSKVYFNRALTYYQLDDFDNTLKDFESHLKLL
jgi:tetratricopeptide (TPR) repeat protein